MQRKSLIFVVISVLGAALIYSLTTFEASAQGGIGGLVANPAEDVYSTGNPQINFSKPPSGASGGLMGLIANSAQDVYTPGGTLSCSEGQVLDEQSGFCIPKESETAEEQPVVGEEEQSSGSVDEEQPPDDDGGGSIDEEQPPDDGGGAEVEDENN